MDKILYTSILAVLSSAALFSTLPSGFAQHQQPNHNLWYEPSEAEVVEKMLAMAKVTKKDAVYDLGCGDGRVVAMAVQKFGCRAVGIDINPQRIRECLDTVKKYRLESFVEKGMLEYRLGDALKIPDLDKASVVILYMHPAFLTQFKPIAKKALRPGSRIVSHDYRWLDSDSPWPPDETVRFKGPNREHELHIWTVKTP